MWSVVYKNVVNFPSNNRIGRTPNPARPFLYLVQFSSVHFDLITPGNAASPIDRRFSCRSWAPLVGNGDDIITELATINGIPQTCFSGRAKGKFLF